ncbi:MAG: SAM-dependent methyltransferase [Firmicutes bacterium HGW-Firmicutes-14]|nr:MAG: SAM-dependent methyltransferase [Firmicutes bacterium HGW-Firmicutes-14]
MKKALCDQFLSHLPVGCVQADFWDGTSKQYGYGEPDFVLKFNKPLSANLVRDPISELGDAYINRVIEIEGDLNKVLRWVFANQEFLSASRSGKVAGQLFSSVNRWTSKGSQKKDISYHYDLGNDFFALWLDDTMSYSCAYFNSAEDNLTQAQLQKIDHTLKKLQLKPGETLLDIGSGWGWLIIRAARDYDVKSTGITLSEEQYQKARERIAELGLDHLVNVKLMDYRDLAAGGRTFDKIASVGMLEHVGKDNLGKFMDVVQKLLSKGGLALLHSITHLTEGEPNSWIRKHIFPGGYIPSLRELIWLLPEYGLHVLDIESLRMHYAMTLDCWTERYEKHFDRIRQERGEPFARKWQLYLRGCAESFRSTGLDVHQILVSKGLNNNLPLTRKYLYE